MSTTEIETPADSVRLPWTGNLFEAATLGDVRRRLELIQSEDCRCGDSLHENALHDLANDDVPVLLAELARLSRGDR
jgi:hypothetical protein